MEYILLILSLLLIVTGIIGSFIPILPGPSMGWLGILCLYLVKGITTNYWLLSITLAIALIVTVLDYLIPAQGTKRFGGSKYGIWGTNIGLIVGIFTPIPFGFLIGPILGACLGELLFDIKDVNRALRAASGSFIGFLTSTFIKFVLSLCFLGLFFKLVWENSKIWF